MVPPTQQQQRPARPSTSTSGKSSRSPATSLPLRPANATPPPRKQQASKPSRIGSSPASKEKTIAQEEMAVEDGVTVVTPAGDLVLNIHHGVPSANGPVVEETAFRVDISTLTKHSTYFQRLLDSSGPFAEGSAVAKQLAALKSTYTSTSDITAAELPRVNVEDIGQISPVSSIRPLMLDFFRIVHGTIRNADTTSKGMKMPPKNIANLAIVADRFGASDVVAHWITRNISTTAPVDRTVLRDLSEEQVRMRLCTGILLGLDRWVATYSRALLLSGSSRWLEPLDLLPDPATEGLWWNISRGVEEELQFRRLHVLATIASLQTFLLSLYTSKTRQCRLGYDTSAACDSFQTGEFVKFLVRVGTVQFRSAFLSYDSDHATVQEPEPETGPEDYAGDIRNLIGTLRTCPSYQIDSNHAHCGPKKALMAGLDFIEFVIGDGGLDICWHCWNASRQLSRYASSNSNPHRWWGAPRPIRFDRKTAGKLALADSGGKSTPGPCSYASAHAFGREFFLAKDKGWDSILESSISGTGLGAGKGGGGRMNEDMRLGRQGWNLKHPDVVLQSLQRAGV